MLDFTARLTCSLEGFGTGSTKLASFEEFVFFFVCQRGAGVWPVALATFLDKPFRLASPQKIFLVQNRLNTMMQRTVTAYKNAAGLRKICKT